MIKISVAIIAFNEEKRIEKCLASVSNIADEIVVIDSLSTDRTKEICESYQAKVISQEFLGYIEQKNFALERCQHDYILSLDADEALSEELITNILKLKSLDNLSDGYSFNRVTNYCGKWIFHCGWYPDQKLRLIRKGKAKWMGVNPHDILKLNNGENGISINGDILHYSYPTISSHIEQTNKFTTIAARASYDKGVRSGFFKIVTRPLLKFLRDYFFKLGILDGRYGFIICSINSLSALLKYSKIKEIQEEKEI
tara:strand:- start:77379 stop:78143 length:765 start_codon:yes stop_codon:yes gene_type:complete